MVLSPKTGQTSRNENSGSAGHEEFVQLAIAAVAGQIIVPVRYRQMQVRLHSFSHRCCYPKRLHSILADGMDYDCVSAVSGGTINVIKLIGAEAR